MPAPPQIPRHDSPESPLPRRLYLGHLMWVAGIALSNALYGLAFLTSLKRWRTEQVWRRGQTVLLPLAVYAALFVASALTSIDRPRSFDALRDLLSLMTLPLGILLLHGERTVRRAVDLVIGSIVFTALWGLVQYAVGSYGAIDRRIPGPFSHYQTFAGVLLVGCLLAVARTSRSSTRREKVLLGSSIVVLVLTLLVTLTRGPWVALFFTGLVFLLLQGRRHLLRLLAGGAIVAVLLALFAPESWGERARSIIDPTDASNYDRMCMLEAGLEMIAERPFLGLGPETVREVYPIYRDPTAPRFQVPHLHNSHLHIAAERGLLSWGVYLWLMVAAAGLAIRSFRAEGGLDGPRADLHLAVLLVLLGFNIAGLFEANWRDTEVQRLVLFVLALPICLGQVPPSTETESP